MEEKMRGILENYPIEIKHLYRGRGAWICETDQGLKLLRVYVASPQRLQWEIDIKQQLKKMECSYIDAVVCNKEGEYLTKDEDEKYILTDWFSGRECNTRDRQEVLKVVAHMADLHHKMSSLDPAQIKDGAQCCENLYEEMCRRLKEFKTIRNYMIHKKQKNDFDRSVYQVLGKYEGDAKRAIQMLEDMDYKAMYENACESVNVCHGEFHQHNIFMIKDHVGIVRFDRMRIELRIYDLYMFMRKILEKNRWNVALGMAMLDTYQRIYPMNYRETRCLYSLFLFPEKFWKIINRYHNTRKSWMSSQNMSKLDKVIHEEQLKSQFMDALNSFCEKIE